MAEPLLVAAIVLLAGVIGFGGQTPDEPSCPASGAWLDAASGGPIADGVAIETLAGAAVVLLGERHDDVEHHRWQLQTLTAIHGRRPDLSLGLEALPRSARPFLEAWVRGDLSEEELLAATRWREVWGFDPQLSMPLLQFARAHRLPVIGLNVPRDLVRQVARDGWRAIPATAREGLGEPASAVAAYEDRLFETYALHRPSGTPPLRRDDPGFQRFVEAQLVWDRAMAEAIVEELRQGGRQVVVAAGRGHVEFGHGIAAQLRDLGVRDVVAALPWPADEPCPTPADGEPIADLLFSISAQPGPR